MTGITWQEARDKVRERWPDAYVCGVANTAFPHAAVYPCGEESEPLGKSVGIPANTVEMRAWLSAYARMTSSQPAKLKNVTFPPRNPDDLQVDDPLEPSCIVRPSSQPDAQPSFEAQMQRSIDDGKLVHKRELDAALEEIERLTGTLQEERTLRSQTEAEMTAELATERGQREKAEVEREAATFISTYDTLRADNTRLRAALELLIVGHSMSYSIRRDALIQARAALQPAEGGK